MCTLLETRRSELMSRVAEGVALGEREDLRGCDSEYEDRIRECLVLVVVVKAAITHPILPTPIPVGRPHARELFELILVGDAHGVALNDDVESFLPVVAASRQNDVSVP